MIFATLPPLFKQLPKAKSHVFTALTLRFIKPSPLRQPPKNRHRSIDTQSIAPATQHANAIAAHVTKYHKNMAFARTSTFSRYLIVPHLANFAQCQGINAIRRTAANADERKRSQKPPSANTAQPPDPH